VHARDGAGVRILGAGRIELHGVGAHGKHGDVLVQP
jgi:hypothetical protein